MKKRLISTYIITLLILSSLLSVPCNVFAQEKTTDKNDIEQSEQPLYQGCWVNMDISGIAGKILGSDVTSTEVGFEVNLKNRFFPVIELGYSDINTTDDETNIHYKATAPYFRLGLNYNVFYKKPHLPGYFTVGLRYGFSSFSYDVQAPDLTDPNWGGISVPVAYEGVKTNTSWAELVLGLRTQVYKSFYMGFTVRYRSQLSLKKSLHSEPYYIPGFGKNKSSNFGFTYNLIYRLPF